MRSAVTRSARLPSDSRNMPIARTLPTASPSGREWEHTRKRSPSRMTCRISSMGLAEVGMAVSGVAGATMAMGRESSIGRLLHRHFLAFARTIHELLDASLEAAGAVGDEAELRNVADAHALLQFKANVALGGFEAGDSVLFGLLDIGHGAIDSHIDAGRFAARIEDHFADVTEGDARIGQLAFDHGPDLLAQGFGHAILMMFTRSMLRHDVLPSSGKPFRITEVQSVGRPRVPDRVRSEIVREIYNLQIHNRLYEMSSAHSGASRGASAPASGAAGRGRVAGRRLRSGELFSGLPGPRLFQYLLTSPVEKSCSSGHPMTSRVP